MGLLRLSLAWVVLAGCYAPEFPLGAPCTTDSDCPASQHCVAGYCGGSEVADDASSDDADGEVSIDDPDGDGIAGAEDNCPDVANADQANEDADKWGDVCDPCPIEANDTPSDPDGDGVADGCDPSPMTPGDQIVLFEGFHAAPPSTWIIGGAVIVGDDIRMVATGTNHTFMSPPLDAPTNVTLMTRVIIEETTGNNDADFGLAVPYNPANDDSVRCELYSPDATQTANRDLSIWDSMRDVEVGSRQFAWVTGTPYLLSLRRTGNDYACRVSEPAAAPVTTSGNTPSMPAQPKLALRAYAASTLISYVLIVQSP
ncbi:MAG TPA: hypothetical protein VIV11_08515 [Kofleriaceae bacterium]